MPNGFRQLISLEVKIRIEYKNWVGCSAYSSKEISPLITIIFNAQQSSKKKEKKL